MKKAPFIIYLFCFYAFISSCAESNKLNAFSYEIEKNVTAKNGAVVSAHPLASQVGVNILKKGGNAVDAAIATQLALAVVYPVAGNIGGGGFTVIHTSDGKNISIDYREKAPGAATRDMYLDEAGNPQLTLSQDGHLASGVPGVIAGIFESMKYATLDFRKLIQPAIDLAKGGFAITQREADGLNNTREEFIKYNTITPVFVKETPWKKGDTLIQEDLAKTLERIRDNGAKGFYEGETAKLIAEEMKRANGIITTEDLKKYQAVNREPIVLTIAAIP